MQRISQPLTHLQSSYEVIVIGSGYGGGIAASRFARAGRKVCVLERGREYLPGDFPNTETQALEQFQVNGPLHRLGSPTGLYELHIDKDITVVKGCGLGGTSLINANVSIRADARVFQDLRWPEELRNDLEHGLEAGYARAEAMLKPNTYPASRPELKKVAYMRACAENLGEKFHLTTINVTFESGVNEVGIEQHACNDCGDCITGCNYGSKNTTRMNYLPDAWNHGAEIFCEVDVVNVRRVGNRWLVIVRPLNVGRELFDAPAIHVFADVVVLGAGALGSTEILLRSAESGLPVSRLLGQRFTGNGDVLGFAYNGEVPINSMGMGSQNPVGNDPPGPCITSVIDARENRPLDEATIIEDGGTPGALAVFTAKLWADQTVLQHKALSADFGTTVKREAREAETVIRGPHHGAANHSQAFLVMAHDGDDGVMRLDEGHLKINWPSVGKRPIFEKINENLAKATTTTKGIYLRNPIWNAKLFGQPLLTVHPLGGCCMGDNAQTGVVDHKGQVFDGASATSLHPNLYVMDGSILPMSVGVNPLLTISAVAERCADLAIKQHGWSASYALPSKPPQNVQPPTVGVRFTETMKGHFSKGNLDYKEADEAGKSDDPFRFVLTIQADDLDKLVADEHYLSNMVGSVEAPMLSPEPLTVTNGKFTLFVRNPSEPGTKNMIYHMGLTARDGTQYWFEGFKVIRDDKGLDLWSDTTTLYITVWQGTSNTGPLVGRGILYIAPDDFIKQLTTTKITNAPNKVTEAKDLVRFGMHFMGELWKTYGIHLVREAVQ